MSIRLDFCTVMETLERVFAIPHYDVPCSQQFNVYVNMVSSPFNFIIQPQADSGELNRLKSAMNEFYIKEKPFVDVSKFKENEIYDVKNDQGQ